MPHGAPSQAVHDEICFFDVLLLLVGLHATARLVPAPSPTVNGSPEDGLAFTSTCVQRAHPNIDPSPPSSSSGIPTAFNDEKEFDVSRSDHTSDMHPIEIGRAANETSKPHPDLDMLLSPFNSDEVKTAQRAGGVCTMAILRQSAEKGGAFFKNTDGLL